MASDPAAQRVSSDSEGAVKESLMAPDPTARGIPTFLIIWFGQMLSLFGSGLTGFALGVWVYRETGVVTQFALIAFSASVPSLLLSPFAGVLVDRWDRRRIMILSNTVAGLTSLTLALLFWSDQIAIWHIYLGTALISACNGFHWPAYVATTSLLAPKRHLGRINGLVQFAEAAAQIAAPALAGLVILNIHIQGLLLIDVVTFLLAALTLLVTHIPKPEITTTDGTQKRPLLQDAKFGWSYIMARPSLRSLLAFFVMSNLILNMVQILFTPLVLGFASPAALGTVLSSAGIGMLVGSILMTAWGGPKRRIYGILGFSTLQAMVLFLGGLRPNSLLVAVAAFLFLFNRPLIFGCSQVIWQSKVAPDVQGRVFAIRRMIAWSSIPLSYALAGPLADYVFEPLLTVHGPLAESVGRIIGVGPGRGIGLLMIILGCMMVLSVICAYLYTPLRRIEQILPDEIKA